MTATGVGDAHQVEQRLQPPILASASVKRDKDELGLVQERDRPQGSGSIAGQSADFRWSRSHLRRQLELPPLLPPLPFSRVDHATFSSIDRDHVVTVRAQRPKDRRPRGERNVALRARPPDQHSDPHLS